MTPTQLAHEIVKWVGLGMLVIITAFVVAYFLQQRQVDDIEWLAKTNSMLVQDVKNLNQLYAQTQYAECLERNERVKIADRELPKLVSALTRDGARNASRFWSVYLETLKKSPPPQCEKPASTK